MKERILEIAGQVGAVKNVVANGRHDGVLFTEFELQQFVAEIIKEHNANISSAQGSNSQNITANNEESSRELIAEQTSLLRQCRMALDDLLNKKPMLAGMLCGTTTLGNMRAALSAYKINSN